MGSGLVLTYDGKKSFTLVEEKVNAKVASTNPTYVPTAVGGHQLISEFTIGAVSEHSISWTQGGVDYMIASKNLNQG